MATATQPIGQSLFDFLDSSKPLETLEAIRNGELGREIDRFVHEQLDRFQIGNYEPFEDLLSQGPRPWLNKPEESNGRSEAEPVIFRAGGMLESGFDLVGQDIVSQDIGTGGQRIQAPKDVSTELGGIDDGLRTSNSNTDQIFRSHRR